MNAPSVEERTARPGRIKTRFLSIAESLSGRKPTCAVHRPLPMEINGLSFSYKDCRVLDSVDLRLRPGFLVGVIGPNGAGKSTLVKLLSRVLTPESGRIRLGDRRLRDWPATELARVLTVVPQNPELPVAFTSWEMVLMGRTPFLGWLGKEGEKDRAIVRQAMMDTGTWGLAKRGINQLSGGERQRVIIARALAQQPRVLLLDEPTAHLDINHQVETLALIARLVKETDLSALTIFHDLNLASHFCDELMLLRNGKVLVHGSPEQVLTRTAIRQAYNVDVTILRHPGHDLPVVLPA